MAAQITIVGCGPGAADYLTPAAIHAVEHARVMVGAQRLLDLFPDSNAERIPLSGKIEDTLSKIETRMAVSEIAVLVSGDPGLFSLAGLVVKRFGRGSCRVIPGISSVQAAFAAIGINWADAQIISAHKQDPESAPNTLRNADKIAILAGRRAALKWIADLGRKLGPGRRIFVCEDLTLDEEQVREVTVQELPEVEAGSRTVVLIVRDRVLEGF